LGTNSYRGLPLEQEMKNSWVNVNAYMSIMAFPFPVNCFKEPMV
jgi:hypothetical protein